MTRESLEDFLARGSRKTGAQLIAERRKQDRAPYGDRCPCCSHLWHEFQCGASGCGKIRPEAAPFSTLKSRRPAPKNRS